MKDHQIAELVNQLTAIGKAYGQTQQLREHIHALIVPALDAEKRVENLSWFPSLRNLSHELGQIENLRGSDKSVLKTIALNVTDILTKWYYESRAEAVDWEHEAQVAENVNITHRPKTTTAEANPLDTQVDGGHYKSLRIQPVEYCQLNKLGFCESSIIKYATRHKDKNGKVDVEKIIHFAKLLIQLEYSDSAS